MIGSVQIQQQTMYIDAPWPLILCISSNFIFPGVYMHPLSKLDSNVAICKVQWWHDGILFMYIYKSGLELFE